MVALLILQKKLSEMAKKGQTCGSCNGNCCFRCENIAVREKFPDFPDYDSQNLMSMSMQGLKRLGIRIVRGESDGRCPQLDDSNRCKLQGPNKPRLCRTWWCGGKYWQPRIGIIGGYE